MRTTSIFFIAIGHLCAGYTSEPHSREELGIFDQYLLLVVNEKVDLPRLREIGGHCRSSNSLIRINQDASLILRENNPCTMVNK